MAVTQLSTRVKSEIQLGRIMVGAFIVTSAALLAAVVANQSPSRVAAGQPTSECTTQGPMPARFGEALLAPSQAVQILQQETPVLREAVRANLLGRTNAALVASAERRKLALSSLIAADASAARKFLLTDAERDILRKRIRGCGEERTILRGALKHFYADFPDNTSQDQLVLGIDHGQEYLLYADDNVSLPSAGDIVVSGYIVDSTVLVENAWSPTKDPTMKITDTSTNEVNTVSGPQKAIVILTHFQGQSDPDIFPGVDDRQRVTQIMGTVSDYYRENSYGRAWFEGAVAPIQSGADVYGYYELAINPTCSLGPIESAARVAAVANDPTIDFSRYNQLVIIGPFQGCGWQGIAGSGHTAWISTYYPVSAYVIGHEMGHNLGFAHANFLDCGGQPISDPISQCHEREYDDDYDIMGSSSNILSPRHLGARRMELLGWFDADRAINTLTAATASPDNMYRLTPIESSLPGLKALRIPRNPNGDSLYIEFRQPIGFDIGMDDGGSGDVFLGATLRTNAGGSETLTWLLDATASAEDPGSNHTAVLPVGQTFSDPRTQTTIEVVSLARGLIPADSILTVRVIAPFDTIAPTIVPSVLPPQVAGEITLSADVTDNIGVSRVSFYDAGNFLAPLATLTAPTSGDTYSIPINTRLLPNGPRTFSIIAEDGFGWYSQASLSTVIENPLPTVAVTAPAKNARLSGTVDLRAIAFGPEGVAKLEFLLAGIPQFGLATRTSCSGSRQPPVIESAFCYTSRWNTLSFPNNIMVPIRARAYGPQGGSGLSEQVWVSVNNPPQPSPRPVQYRD